MTDAITQAVEAREARAWELIHTIATQAEKERHNQGMVGYVKDFGQPLIAKALHEAAALTSSQPPGGEDRERLAKDEAYHERNQLVSALAHLFPSGIARTNIEGWDPEWHGCVFVDLPTGQASWHYHDREAGLFADLPPYTKPWDGHSTPEKYARLAILRQPVAAEVAEMAKRLDAFAKWAPVAEEAAALLRRLALPATGDGWRPTQAVADVIAERRRQIGTEGWTAEHDDQHNGGEMAAAGACYAIIGIVDDPTDHFKETTFARYWPWHRDWWKPKDRRHNLIRAGALIIAEIERLDRLADAPSQPLRPGLPDSDDAHGDGTPPAIAELDARARSQS